MKQPTQFVVLTGGPGAGKTAVLELAKKSVCSHVAILPEAASVLFKGGFWRLPSVSARIAAQKSIFYIQQEMEYLVQEEKVWSLGLCDRGTLDSLAYWPQSHERFWAVLKTTQEKEYAKYLSVIHLRTPTLDHGYNHQNPIRTESVLQALEIDQTIAKIWQNHPGYIEIKSTPDFLDKAQQALSSIEIFKPKCCQDLS